MGRLWRASPVGGVQPVLAPGSAEPARLCSSRLRIVGTKRSASPTPVNPCGLGVTIMQGVNAPPQRLGAKTTTTRWDRRVSLLRHNDNRHSQGLPHACQPVWVRRDHHAGRQCTAKRAGHKDSHHRWDHRGQGAPATLQLPKKRDHIRNQGNKVGDAPPFTEAGPSPTPAPPGEGERGRPQHPPYPQLIPLEPKGKAGGGGHTWWEEERETTAPPLPPANSP